MSYFRIFFKCNKEYKIKGHRISSSKSVDVYLDCSGRVHRIKNRNVIGLVEVNKGDD